jgi:hypothetical protein
VGEAVAGLGVAVFFHPCGSNQECEGARKMHTRSIGVRFAVLGQSGLARAEYEE